MGGTSTQSEQLQLAIGHGSLCKPSESLGSAKHRDDMLGWVSDSSKKRLRERLFSVCARLLGCVWGWEWRMEDGGWGGGANSWVDHLQLVLPLPSSHCQAWKHYEISNTRRFFTRRSLCSLLRCLFWAWPSFHCWLAAVFTDDFLRLRVFSWVSPVSHHSLIALAVDVANDVANNSHCSLSQSLNVSLSD